MSKTKKSVSSDFTFSVNRDVSHLPKPDEAEPYRDGGSRSKKPGPKVDPNVGKRDKMAATWLSEKEMATFKSKLQGKSASVVLREFILNYKG